MDDLKLEPTSPQAVAARLQLTRRSFKLDSGEFAESAGIKKNTYSQYEGGKRIPDLDYAIKLCDRYDLTLDWIYRGDPSGLPYELADQIHALRRERHSTSRK